MLKDSVTTLMKGLRDDPDFFRAYKDNISVNIQDVFNDKKNKGKSIRELSDMAAERFLNFFIGQLNNGD